MDDHSLFRESLSRLLEAEPEFTIAGSCASVTEALAAVADRPVDVVLLDYDLGDEQGTAFLDEARRRGFSRAHSDGYGGDDGQRDFAGFREQGRRVFF